MTQSGDIDTEQLFNEASYWVQEGDSEQAISCLKRLLEATPEDTMALYMLATVHASLEMYDRAVEELVEVTNREPEFHVARFQLGMIFMANGWAEDTLTAWEAFAELPENDTFFLFRRGIEHFYNDAHEECLRDLQAAIDSNESYLSVLDDMRNILTELRGRRSRLS